jgi:UDP-N-acetylmuramoyl-L-alanyl-D-glutamate--2,6-diaminopimelate ligase
MSMPAEQLTSAPTLADLLHGFVDAPAIPVAGIASDSRLLAEGYLFLACQGIASHGVDYLEEALSAGVIAIAFDASTAELPTNVGVPVIAVEDLAGKLGEVANRFYDHPSQELKVIGVTGTNGKTTVAWLIAQCEMLLGESCGYLGTLGYGVGELAGGEGMTTPAAVELHGRLAEFVERRATCAAIEVSSHALSQRRVDGVRFEAALFTNLSRDHLDYHADMEQYFDSKASLFLDADVRSRIVNIDSEWGSELAARCGAEAIIVSTQPDRTKDREAEFRRYLFVRSVVTNERGSEFSFASTWGDGAVSLPLPGDFNVENAALVLTLLLGQGVDPEQACAALSRVSAPPGRLQRASSDGVATYIDYAHTPGAVQSALQALRAHCKGELWCVFGCGGERDAGKRPLMASAAEEFADHVVVTSDNPRNEAPQSIIDAIVAGLRQPESATVIEDRATAIAWAIGRAATDDVVLIAGKGHEAYQQVGEKTLPFSDLLVARAALGCKEPEASDV